MEKKPRGRPPKGKETQQARIYLRAVEFEKALLEEAARIAKLSLSDWIRDRLLKSAKREILRYKGE